MQHNGCSSKTHLICSYLKTAVTIRRLHEPVPPAATVAPRTCRMTVVADREARLRHGRMTDTAPGVRHQCSVVVTYDWNRIIGKAGELFRVVRVTRSLVKLKALLSQTEDLE